MSTFDIVAYGATGFTGRQVARYLAEHAPETVSWAVAGRNRDKLEAIAKETGAGGVIVADSQDPSAVAAMVEKARVILTTAGPYARYGTPVVEACVRSGVDYVDITGETPWVRDLIDRFHERAAAGGTRIVPFCGCDSVPSDIGTLMMVEHFRDRGLTTKSVSASFRMKGGLNGGTLATVLTMAERGQLDRLADPFVLNPAGPPSSADAALSSDLHGVQREDRRGVWLAPFAMAPINTRVVRRSAGLRADYGAPYGSSFSYSEAMETNRRRRAWALAAGSMAARALLARSWARLLAMRFGPAPGEGPRAEVIEGGFLQVRFLAEADSGERALGTWKFDGDPGNRFTVMSLCESALALVVDREELPGGMERGGVLTPATALGLPLLQRLERAGVATEIEPL